MYLSCRNVSLGKKNALNYKKSWKLNTKRQKRSAFVRIRTFAPLSYRIALKFAIIANKVSYESN